MFTTLTGIAAPVPMAGIMPGTIFPCPFHGSGRRSRMRAAP